MIHHGTSEQTPFPMANVRVVEKLEYREMKLWLNQWTPSKPGYIQAKRRKMPHGLNLSERMQFF